jgi:CPA2 family monovalent cation:H+ antiporter-2
MLIGLMLVPRAIRALRRLESPELMTVVSSGLCFGLAELANHVGFSGALGAFVAGVLVAESGEGTNYEHLTASTRDMFTAIFFVSIGMSVDPAAALANLPQALTLVAAVVLGQGLIVSFASLLSGKGLRRALTAGLSLGQIGEFGFIMAGVGVAAKVTPAELPTILVTVAVLTTFSTGFFLSRAERIVSWVDRQLPRRFGRILSLYEAWIAAPEAQGKAGQGPVEQLLRLVALDGAALLIVTAAVTSWAPSLGQWAIKTWGVSETSARVWIAAGGLIVGAPLLAALLRNAVRLARSVAQPMSGGSPQGARAVSLMVYLAVLVAVGFPTMAVMRPLTGGFYASAIIWPAVIIVSVMIWRRAALVEDELRSGVELVAALVTRAQVSGEEGHTDTELAEAGLLLPPLREAARLRILPGALACGQTLTSLNLRARTGATVIGILRSDATACLPTGREKLEQDDTLLLAGTPEAILAAKTILTEQSPAEAQRELSQTQPPPMPSELDRRAEATPGIDLEAPKPNPTATAQTAD